MKHETFPGADQPKSNTRRLLAEQYGQMLEQSNGDAKHDSQIPDYTTVEDATENTEDTNFLERVDTQNEQVSEEIESNPLPLTEDMRVDVQPVVESEDSMEPFVLTEDMQVSMPQQAKELVFAATGLTHRERARAQSAVEDIAALTDEVEQQEQLESLKEFLENPQAFADSHENWETAHEAKGLLVDMIAEAQTTDEREHLMKLHKELPGYAQTEHHTSLEQEQKTANTLLQDFEKYSLQIDHGALTTARTMHEQITAHIADFPEEPTQAEQLLHEMTWRSQLEQKIKNLQQLHADFVAVVEEKIALKERAEQERATAEAASHKALPKKSGFFARLFGGR